MTDWSRRSVLRALGLGATAPALAPLLGACGGAGQRRRAINPPRRTADEIRAQLRWVVSDLSRRYPQVSAHATISQRGGAAVDPNERGANRNEQASLVLTIYDNINRFEQATTDLSDIGIALAAKRLSDRVPASRATPAAFGKPQDFAVTVNADPATYSPADWLERVDQLYQRARRVGGSRVVYRGAYLTVEDSRTFYIDNDRDLSQRIVRTRGGVLLVAWTGSAPTVDDASCSGTIGLEALDVTDDDLEAAADRALSLLTARPTPSGQFDVVLDPTVAALIAHECVGAALGADLWYCGEARAASQRSFGSELISLVDDATVPGGYGSYFFDDEGHPAQSTPLIERGEIRGPITDRATAAALTLAATGNGRRSQPLGAIAPRLSNITLAPGETPVAELLAGIEHGLLIEGGLSARADPRSHRFALRATRAQEIKHGKTTGARYATTHLRGDVLELLDQVSGVSPETVRFPASEGEVAISMGGSFLRSRCEVSGG